MSGNCVELRTDNEDLYKPFFEVKKSLWPIPDYLQDIHDKELHEYALLESKSLNKIISSTEELRLLHLEVGLSHRLPYFNSFKTFLEDANNGKNVCWDSNKNEEISKSEMFIRSLNVKNTWNYISQGWTFYSPSKWKCTWGSDNYKGLCTTWVFNILWKLWFKKVSESTTFNIDTLKKMWLQFVTKVNSHNPWKSGYMPRNGDVAVWPRFQKASWKYTQHMAVWVNWAWRSDTKQSKMACYNNEPNEPLCKIYRYGWIDNQDNTKLS